MKNSDSFVRTLGPSFMSQVWRVNPNASRMDLRKLLHYPNGVPVGEIPRDRLPETIEEDYPSLVTSEEPIAKIDSKWYGKSVAIIGAGAAGLCAGYELMRSGLQPVFFEIQTLDENAWPGGRAYSVDFSADLRITKKTIGEMGCMRFPATHTTLHAYVDKVFKGEYRYDGGKNTQWPEFIDPLLYKGDGDVPQKDWTVVYDTAFMARGVNNREFYRVQKDTPFSQINSAIQDVSSSFGEMIFGDSNSPGILFPIVTAYAIGDAETIISEWKKLNDMYQDKSIFEVLRDLGWDKVITGDNQTSRLNLFGELGIGSGGFDAFWGTTFMEILRIKLHGDESDQSAFLGGTRYMLKPFLSHRVATAKGDTVSMQDVTKNRVITSPVTRISALQGGGVSIGTEDNNYYNFPIAILTASPTAISSSIFIDEPLLSVNTWNGIRNIPLTGCGKIMIAFPKPFWKGTSKTHPGSDAICTTVTDYNLRQIYTFDDYHWGSGSPAGVLMISYTWGDWAHKLGSLPPEAQVRSAVRMLKGIYASEWDGSWDQLFENAISTRTYKTITWSHERGFAGGYRMADLNRYTDQQSLWQSNFVPAVDNAALLLAGEATAWLGLSGWVEGALHTGINTTFGVEQWFYNNANNFSNWANMTDPGTISGATFAVPADPGNTPFIPPAE